MAGAAGEVLVTLDVEHAFRLVGRETFDARGLHSPAPQDSGVWRFRELVRPLPGDPVTHPEGNTALYRREAVARFVGLPDLALKHEGENPTGSFKDRGMTVAVSLARHLGMAKVACASTGNLANSVAANAASAGLKSYVFIPSDLEQGKVVNSLVYGANVIAIKGHYDEVNRLCAEIAGKFGWAFVNVNMRPYYAEGSKSMAYEIIEQSGWRIPQGRHCKGRGSADVVGRTNRRVDSRTWVPYWRPTACSGRDDVPFCVSCL